MNIFYKAICTAVAACGRVVLPAIAAAVVLTAVFGNGMLSVTAVAKANNTVETAQGQGGAAVEQTMEVTIRLAGEFLRYTVKDGQVRDVLKQAGIALGEHDEVSDPLGQWVENGDIIVVTRHEYVTVEKEEAIAKYQEEIPTCLLTQGKTKPLFEGKDGLRVKTYAQHLVDGKVAEEELVDDKIVREAVPAKVLVGTDSAAISPLDFGFELDENGAPIEYEEVLQSQRAAGYSARAGAKTASGRKAVVGHVAVNPKVIPYGTKLYIQSADGKFVYGYAIAADTGTALRDGRIDVDLFYASHLESRLNGIRQVDIYILEYPQ